MLFKMRSKIVISIALLGALAVTAQAGELVTLRNGFEMRCDHHAQVEGRTRLYLSAGEDSYVELAPGEIAEIEKRSLQAQTAAGRDE